MPGPDGAALAVAGPDADARAESWCSAPYVGIPAWHRTPGCGAGHFGAAASVHGLFAGARIRTTLASASWCVESSLAPVACGGIIQ